MYDFFLNCKLVDLASNCIEKQIAKSLFLDKFGERYLEVSIKIDGLSCIENYQHLN